MRSFKRVAFFVAALIVALTTILFVIENTQPVSLAFAGWSAPQLPVSVLILLALLAGMVIGLALFWLVKVRSRVA
ncbi:LapA family protein [Pseudomonas corrugata]|uniref:LapA family protein n=1 Tax=Pseudomonas corrugata TaxID=47879 RepID=UPI001585E36C|nr:LapA family protein [Pseudomonas corrugata]NUT67394.1 LapA family protein [Pseudomonas corrugata]